MCKIKKTVAILMLLTLFVVSIAHAEVTEEQRAIATGFIANNVRVEGTDIIIPSSLQPWIRTQEDDVFVESINITAGEITMVVFLNPAGIPDIVRIAGRADERTRLQDGLQDITQGFTIEADTGAATEMLSGFKPIIELIIGIVVVLITFGMTLFSSFDITYLALPIFRNKADAGKSDGKSWTKLVTQDAIYAVEQSTTSNDGKNMWMVYLKRRVVSYIFLGIILFILLTGNITVITDIAINMVSGIMGVLNNLAI